jgi:two-component system KDP operon response regulator KdpE
MKVEHILVVDDEKSIRMVISEALETAGYRVQSAAEPAQALALFKDHAFDLAMIDLRMQSALDGIGLLKEIRRRSPSTVVIVLTGFGTLDSAIMALREGAFDYLTKPASIAQIIESVERGLSKRREHARHQQLITQLEQTLRDLKSESERESAPTRVEERFAKSSNLVIDRHKRLVVHAGEPVELTAVEFDILDYLAHHADRVITASELLRATQGYELMEADARPLVRVHIQRLRQKLEDDPLNPQFIVNVRGKGYRFVG